VVFSDLEIVMNKTFNKTLLSLYLLGMLAPATVGMAEDIDIYKSSSDDVDKPNILVVIDNSANWAAASQHWPGGIKQGQAELSALRTVISDLNEDVKLGLMMLLPVPGQQR
jgi:type IV pilus assembly protein PilY1